MEILKQLYCRQLNNYNKLSAFLFDGIRCEENINTKIDNTKILINLVEREILRQKHLKSCVDLTNISYPTKPCKESLELIQTDENWAIQNPLCLSLENWEKYSINLCATLNLKFQKIEKKCDIALELTTKSIPCDILATFTITQKLCDLGLKPTIIEHECKIEHKILVEKTNCEIDYKTYFKCKEFGLTYDTIKLILDQKLNLKWHKGQLYLQGAFGDYSIKGLTNINLSNLTPDMRGEFLEDPHKFIKKYFSDYKLPNHIINKILQ